MTAGVGSPRAGPPTAAGDGRHEDGHTEDGHTDEGDDLGGLAMALTGDRGRAAELLGAVAAIRRRSPADAVATRNLLAAHALRAGRTPPATGSDRDPMPAELEPVAASLDRLPPLARVAVVLTRLIGLTHAETAAILDRPVGSVSRAIRDGLDELDTDPYALSATLTTLSWQRPAAAEVRGVTRRSDRRRRQRRRLIAISALAAAVLVASTVVVPLTRVQAPLYTRAAGEWTYGFALTPQPGWQLTSHVVGPDTETASIVQDSTGSGSSIGCQVVVGLPGSALAAAGPRQPRAFADRRILGRPSLALAGGVQWWPGAGVVVRTTCTDGPGAAATARWVAGTMMFGVVPVQLPFVLDELPPGTTVRNVGTQFGRPQLALDSTPPANRAEDELTVTLYGEGDDAGYTLYGANGAVESKPVWSFRDDTDGTQACRNLQHEQLCVEDPSTRSGGMDMGSAAGYGLLLRVVAHTRPAASAVDRSTWFDARDAVPR